MNTRCYFIKSERGYWLSGGQGYTQSEHQAGIFTTDDLNRHNLDGCTLYNAPDQATRDRHAKGDYSAPAVKFN